MMDSLKKEWHRCLVVVALSALTIVSTYNFLTSIKYREGKIVWKTGSFVYALPNEDGNYDVKGVKTDMIAFTNIEFGFHPDGSVRWRLTEELPKEETE